ncbi:MAG: hypothetical protein J2P30_02630, partial [Actinobacteria bacterium]|nr:hypothetical protein [Actinomycetota bacterium]
GSQPLNKGGQAAIGSVSCPATTACSAGGSYSAGLNGHLPIVQAFVVSKTRGIWRRAEEVPGTAALNTAGRARVNSVSCAAPGDCSAGGYYGDALDHQQAFVVNETSGTWGTAIEVPGTAALDKGNPGAAVLSVSCAAPGDCSAGGVYSDAAGHQQAFVVNETNGTWGTAIEAPGSGARNAGGSAQINSVSCGAVGNCTAAGYYASSSAGGIPATQAMIVTETGGTWGTAKEVPGTAALNSGGSAQVYSVSCASAGNCSAGGAYTNRAPATQAFVVNETNGTWGTATQVPGTAVLNKRKLAQVSSVSCAGPGNCSAGGFYQDSSFHNQAFVVDETNGTWGAAQEVPGTAALDQGSPGAMVVSLSCAAAGDCSAGGVYADASDLQQAFVADESGGTWGAAREVPGTAALNAGGLAATQAVSCAPAGGCSAGGDYTNANMNTQVFAVSQTGS